MFYSMESPDALISLLVVLICEKTVDGRGWRGVDGGRWRGVGGG